MTQKIQLVTYVDAATAERLTALARTDRRSLAYIIREALLLYLAAGERKRGR